MFGLFGTVQTAAPPTSVPPMITHHSDDEIPPSVAAVMIPVPNAVTAPAIALAILASALIAAAT